ncbi:MAG TPA: hypothetical protein VNH44_17750 [Micropepsaceae bacterium]|nr:hypothetical protein [Micropepsaceae bacterium]
MRATSSWRGEGRLLDLLKTNPNLTRLLSADELAESFDLGYHFKDVDLIFARVFGAAG